jgi:hypothetical protein
MKTQILIGLLLIGSAFGSAGTPPRVSRVSLAAAEKVLDDRLKGVFNDITVTGFSRGVYLEGYGVVLTAEVNLFPAPYNMVHTTLSKEEQNQTLVEKRKRLPKMRIAVQQALADLAASAVLDGVPGDEQITVSLLMLRYPWENGLPVQMILKAPKKRLMEAQHAGPAALDAVISVTEY